VPADQENERYHRYRQQRAVLRFHLVEGQVLEGSLKWYDRYAVKLRPTDRGPDVTVHKHAVRYYEVGAPGSRQGSPGRGEEA
jgi:sRNA-binding regulator protein Hfq